MSFNNIVAPAVALITVDSNCFSAVLYALEAVSSAYSTINCTFNIFTIPVLSKDSTEVSGLYNYAVYACLDKAASVAYTPAFLYNYQCSATLLQTYAPVFILMAFVSSFAEPLFFWSIRFAVGYSQWADPDKLPVPTPAHTAASSSTPASNRSNRSAGEGRGGKGANNNKEAADVEAKPDDPLPRDIPRPSQCTLLLLRLLPPILRSPEEERSLVESMQGKKGWCWGEKDRKRDFRLFNAHALFIKVLTDFIIVFSYGVVAPLLGFAVVASLLLYSLNFTHIIKTIVQRRESLEMVLDDLQHMKLEKHLFVGKWLIVLFSALFLSCFLEDVAGDDVGWSSALVAPACMIALPMLLCLLSMRVDALTSPFFPDAPSDPFPVHGGMSRRTINTEIPSASPDRIESGRSRASLPQLLGENMHANPLHAHGNHVHAHLKVALTPGYNIGKNKDGDKGERGERRGRGDRKEHKDSIPVPASSPGSPPHPHHKHGGKEGDSERDKSDRSNRWHKGDKGDGRHKKVDEPPRHFTDDADDFAL